MSNRDPYSDRDPDYARRSVPSDAGIGVGTLAAIAIAAILIIGGLFYAMSDRTPTTAANPPPASTVGKSEPAPAPAPGPRAPAEAK